MVSRIHYSEDILQQLLSDRLGRDEADVTAHVESCETCQTRLESVCQSGLSWDDVAGLLKPDETSERDAATANDRIGDHHVRFLEPSERSGSIGRFARYEITEVLGRGGMGIVMRAFDPALDRHSAIKVLAPELASSAAARRRFSREAKSAAADVHPHVVPIQTVDEQNGLPYLVMPVIEGRSLEDRVREHGPLELIETVRIVGQVAEGLAAAHSQGLVHRDVKPANILLENGVERVMITDFGLARAADDASLTRSGTLAGTPQYMSPEQAHVGVWGQSILEWINWGFPARRHEPPMVFGGPNLPPYPRCGAYAESAVAKDYAGRAPDLPFTSRLKPFACA